jgi:hypothetical protein
LTPIATKKGPTIDFQVPKIRAAKPPKMVDSENVNHSPVEGAPTSITDGVNAQVAEAGEEPRNPKESRVAPSETVSTGQPLTHYHSLLYSLLSWENPRATAISYASVVSLILASRYLPLLRWGFKFLYLSLGLTAALEVAGRLVLSHGLASSFRPRRYYTIPKETLEGILEDVGQLIDFFLIEFQRVLFAENVLHTITGFTAAFLSYWLIKIVPIWGLSLIAVTIAYLGPLFYISNRELIDEQLENVHKIINDQATQVKELANQHTANATGLMKQYASDYSAKAQGYIGNKPKAQVTPKVKQSDFPQAPQDEPISHVTTEKEPLLVT